MHFWCDIEKYISDLTRFYSEQMNKTLKLDENESHEIMFSKAQRICPAQELSKISQKCKLINK